MRFLSKARQIAKSRGIRYLFVAGAGRIRARIRIHVTIPIQYCYYKLFKSGTFVFQNRRYEYFYHKYNVTWRNERAIEIPIVWNILKSTEGNVLEVGNVLSHYYKVKHDIVDKYEKAEGVTTQDVTEFQTAQSYNLIISISTLEHVGWDENPSNREVVNDQMKVLQAINHLKTLLKPNGRIVVTLPLGYNPLLDELLKSGRLKFDKQFYLKRMGKNGWIETEYEDVADAKFSRRVPTANALLIGIIEA